MSIISVENLHKSYTVIKKEEGIKGSLKALLSPQKESVVALDDINFSIAKGETVGYIGSNGAGKSTTIKCMIGILQPTSGTILIDGKNPQKQRTQIAQDIGVVFGQRSNLIWDIRLNESFELNKRIYQIDNTAYKRNRDDLIDLLDMGAFVNTPVRQLSLGQRMRGEIASALLHSPSILFLDEPTIGLDFESRNKILDYVKRINAEKEVTVILTSHNITDIEKVCRRVIIINKGKVIEDGSLTNIADKVSPYKIIKVVFEKLPENEVVATVPYCKHIKTEGNAVTYHFNKTETSIKDIMRYFVDHFNVSDFEISSPEIEDVIKKVYTNQPS